MYPALSYLEECISLKFSGSNIIFEKKSRVKFAIETSTKFNWVKMKPKKIIFFCQNLGKIL